MTHKLPKKVPRHFKEFNLQYVTVPWDYTSLIILTVSCDNGNQIQSNESGNPLFGEFFESLSFDKPLLKMFVFNISLIPFLHLREGGSGPNFLTLVCDKG